MWTREQNVKLIGAIVPTMITIGGRAAVHSLPGMFTHVLSLGQVTDWLVIGPGAGWVQGAQ